VIYLDNLKISLIAAIIAIHGVLGYTDTGWWSYGDAREVTLSTVSTVALMIVVGPFGLLVIPLLFLVAGLLTPASVQRKGPAKFARDRLLRLGVPFVVYVLLIQPPVVYAVDHKWGNAQGSYWQEFLGSDGQPDAGPLWFVGVLLIYSLIYAGCVAARPPGSHRMRRAKISTRHLGLAAAAIVVPTFLIRLAWPLGSESAADLNLWEWPACSTLFGLGVVAARHGWVSAVPQELRRQCRNATLAAAAALLVLAGTSVGLLGIDDKQLFGGWHWPALAFAACECALAVFGAVWTLGLMQRFDQPHRRTELLARASYPAFIVQTPVLVGTAVALRALDLPAEIKALLVAAVSVPAAFALAGLLLRAARPLASVRYQVTHSTSSLREDLHRDHESIR
jgi:Acyltransferase family